MRKKYFCFYRSFPFLLVDRMGNAMRRSRADFRKIVLRAIAAHRCDCSCALPLLAEALGIALPSKCYRVLAESLPLAAQVSAEQVIAPAFTKGEAGEARSNLQPCSTSDEQPMIFRNGLLTAKEAEIMMLLAKGMSNKHIARTMEISSETVKWHIKNLFMKLDAGTRKQVVERARLLGLLAH